MIKHNQTQRQIVTGLAIALFALISGAAARPAKNVILMVSDGAGFNSYLAASYYQHGQLGKQPYDQPGFVKFGCTHYSLNNDGTPMGYDPTAMWRDPGYVKSQATDSAAAATALNTGVKTLNGRIDTDRLGKELTSFAQIADRLGKSTGAVTTVQLSDATPAAVWAHNTSRSNNAAIADEMIFGSGLDVVMGAGSPDFNDNGRPDKTSPEYVGGADTWQMLKADKTGKGWLLIQSKDEFEALAKKSAPAAARVFGVAQAHTSLQFYRDGKDPAPAAPLNANVPALDTMAVAAINVLSQNEKGFYLMIEGGASDRANHANNLPRLIEEMTDFNRAVEAVVHWVETSSSWDDTLLIITSDHETGMLWGPKIYDYADVNGNNKFDPGVDTFNGFVPVAGNGEGKLPSAEYGYKSHTNALVPLFAQGPGSELFSTLVDGVDPHAAQFWNFSGQYVDNTDVFTVMSRAVEPTAASKSNTQK